MPQNGISPRKRISDLSDDTADLRGSLNLSPDAVECISRDMKAMMEDWKRQNPHRRPSDAVRQGIYEAAAAPHGATVEQARLIAFRTNNPRRNPKGHTLRTSSTERLVWGEVAKLHGISIKAAASLALACFLTRLDLTDLVARIDPLEGAAD